MVFLMSDEDIFPILHEKRFPDPSTEDKIIRGCPNDGTNTSNKSSKKWIE